MKPMTFMAGPCTIESFDLIDETCHKILEAIDGLDVDFYFKSSFDKANRTSIKSFRGPGLEKGLEMLAQIKQKYGVKILSDIHLPEQAIPASEVLDILQIPAFMCRQTDLVTSVCKAALNKNRKVAIKKGQFIAPWEAENIVNKCVEIGLSKDNLFLTERGTSFGYNNLVVDMTSFGIMNKFGVTTIMDSTHSTQLPGGDASGTGSSGRAEFIDTLAQAAIAAGAGGIFMEIHPNPSQALCDPKSQRTLTNLRESLERILKIREIVHQG